MRPKKPCRPRAIGRRGMGGSGPGVAVVGGQALAFEVVALTEASIVGVEFSAKLNIRCRLADMPAKTLRDADEVFITSTAGGIMPGDPSMRARLATEPPGPVRTRQRRCTGNSMTTPHTRPRALRPRRYKGAQQSDRRRGLVVGAFPPPMHSSWVRVPEKEWPRSGLGIGDGSSSDHAERRCSSKTASSVSVDAVWTLVGWHEANVWVWHELTVLVLRRMRQLSHFRSRTGRS